METKFYSVTKENRKELIQALENAVHWKAVYKGAPTFEYVVENYTIGRNGEVRSQDEMPKEILEKLYIQGF